MRKNSLLWLLACIFLVAGIFVYWQHSKPIDGGLSETIISLEKVEPKSITKWNQTSGFLKFSPDGKYLAVSSEGGMLRLFDTNSKKIIFEKHLGIGFFKAMVFAADSKKIYLGESSPDGYLYCLSLPNGKELWKYSTSKELGNNLAKESYPGINNIMQDKQGKIYFTAGRSEKKGNKSAYTARVYALDSNTGKTIWKFPAQENLDTNTYHVDVAQDGSYAALSTMNFSNEEKEKYPGGSIYFLAGKTGQEIWHHTFPPIAPFKKTAIWYNPIIAPDKERLAVLTSDGRGYLLNKKGDILWERPISTPKEVSGIPIYATGVHAYFQGDSLIFSTSGTFDASKGKYDLPVEHPNCNTVLAYDLAGNLIWKWKAGGYMEEQNFSADGKYMLCPVAKNFRTRDIEVHGSYLLDISQGKKGKVSLVKKYKPATKGPIVSADISEKYIAALETPVLLADGIEKVGKYQLHIWQR